MNQTKLLQAALLVGVLLLAGCTSPEATPGPAVDAGATTTTTPEAARTPPKAAPETPVETVDASDPLPPPMPNVTFVESNATTKTLSVTLTAARGTATVNGTAYGTNLYDNRLLPPVWKIQRDETLLVKLNDRRPLKGSSSGDAHPHGLEYADYTNLHFHGLNVKAEAHGDSVFIRVNPEATHLPPDSYDYSIHIPADHPQGLFWWHPHPHGASHFQLQGGMSGAMIIGDIHQQHYPQVKVAEERVFLLRDFSNDTTSPSYDSVKPMKTVNGATWSSMEMAPGEAQFWRFANIGSNLNFDMSLVNVSSGARVPFYVMAVDGNVLQKVDERDHLFLHPGARVEGFIVVPDAGTYVLQSNAVTKNLPLEGKPQHVEPETPLAIVKVKGKARESSSVDVVKSAVAQAPDKRFVELEALAKADKYDVPRDIRFTHNPNFGINGQKYNVSRIDVTANFSDVEKWVVRNPTPALHVFHIHQLDFLVAERDGQWANSTGLQDTALVPPGGNVTLWIPFTERHTIGKYVFHCHYLAHEDRGMMANIEVKVRDAPSA